MTLYVPKPAQPLRVLLECGHARTIDYAAVSTDCWVCGTVETITAKVSD